jgi:dihydrofolate reductase
MTIRIVAAVSQDGVIAINNKIPWLGKYPEDLKRFKKKTIGSVIIMGRKTFKSIGKKLEYRINVVITRHPELIVQQIENAFTFPISKMFIFNSLEKAIEFSREQYPTREINIIGGAQLYQSGIQYADVVDITVVPENYIDRKFSEYALYFPFREMSKYKWDIRYYDCSRDTRLKIIKYYRRR